MKRIIGLMALVILAGCGAQVAAEVQPAGGEHEKVFVCKYTGTPGVDEELQTGQNPISVDYKEGREPGNYFNDGQGRSYVLEYDEGQDEPPVTDCPPPDNEPPTTTSTSTTSTTTTTTTQPPTPGLFAFSAVGTTCEDGDPLINITFPPRPELNGEVGLLSFSSGGSVELTFIAGATVQVFYPEGVTAPITLTYVLGEEEASASVEYPAEGECVVTPTTTVAPTTTVPPVPNTQQVPIPTTVAPVTTTTTPAPSTTTTTVAAAKPPTALPETK